MHDYVTHPLFQLAPVAMSVLDCDLRQIAANDRFYGMFGYEPGADLTSASLTFADDAAETDEYIARVLAYESAGSIEKRYVRRDGTVFWGRLTARRIELDGQDVLIGTIEEVQQQMELLESLAASMHEAQDQAELRARFVSQVSHELRNPLHLIAGTSELIERADIPLKQRQQAASILAEATSLSALVDDLLDIGRGDVGSLTLHDAAFSIRALTHRVRQTVATKAATKGLTVEVEVDDGVPVHAMGDEGRLRQILLNLLTNAVKFTERGSVTMTVRTDAAGITSFRVTDSGPGIPEDGLDTIFEPFVRLSRTEAGAGLGLAIANRLAILMSGTLTAENVEPHGAAFELRLPLPETSAPVAATRLASADGQPATAARAERRSLHVLVVEDSHENQLLAAAQLDSLGHTYDIVGDGYEALAALASSDYDAALMDWHLPKLNGLETTREIRIIEDETGAPRLPVIALTARAMTADIEACFDAGADDHLAKPAGLETLERVLDRWTSDRVVAMPEERPVDGDIDHASLDDLFDNLGDVDLVSSIVESYLDQLDERVERIINADDPDVIESAAHVLASTSSIVGAAALSTLARTVEDVVRSGQTPDPDHLDELAGQARRTSTSLRSVFNRMRAQS